MDISGFRIIFSSKDPQSRAPRMGDVAAILLAWFEEVGWDITFSISELPAEELSQ